MHANAPFEHSMRPYSLILMLTHDIQLIPLRSCRHSLIRADDGNRAQNTLRPSPGCGVFQNGSRCPRQRNNLSSTLISSPAVSPPISSRSATQTSCHAFDKAIPSSQARLIRHYSTPKSKVPRCRRSLRPSGNSYLSCVPAVLPSSSSLSMFS